MHRLRLVQVYQLSFRGLLPALRAVFSAIVCKVQGVFQADLLDADIPLPPGE